MTMKQNMFKYHTKQQLEGDPLVMVVTQSMIQQFAEDNFEQRLTDTEINRITTIFFEHDHELSNLMFAAIKEVLSEDSDWSEVDKDFAKAQAENEELSEQPR